MKNHPLPKYISFSKRNFPLRVFLNHGPFILHVHFVRHFKFTFLGQLSRNDFLPNPSPNLWESNFQFSISIVNHTFICAHLNVRCLSAAVDCTFSLPISLSLSLSPMSHYNFSRFTIESSEPVAHTSL